MDFYLPNGRPLTGGDPGSLKLIRALDPLAPTDTDLRQIGCRASVAVTNFLPFNDTWDRLHIDFRQRKEPRSSSPPGLQMQTDHPVCCSDPAQLAMMRVAPTRQPRTET